MNPLVAVLATSVGAEVSRLLAEWHVPSPPGPLAFWLEGVAIFLVMRHARELWRELARLRRPVDAIRRLRRRRRRRL